MADGTAKLPSEVDKIVGALIRAARKDRKMSQEQLGDLLGLTFQQVQKYEKGTNRVSVGRLYEISKALDKPVDFFFDKSLIDGASFDESSGVIPAIDRLGSNDYARVIRALSKIKDPRLMAATIDTVERLSRIEALKE